MTSEKRDDINNCDWNLGELYIKVQLHDDIRRIQISNQGVTYNDLVLVMQQVFNGKLSEIDEVILKYKDEDGDLVTIFDSSDLENAIQSSCHTLKIIILLNQQTQESEKDISKGCDQGFVAYHVSTVRKQLACIRDRVLHLLDKLDTPQDMLDGNLFEERFIPFQGQESTFGKNADGFHLVTMTTATQSTIKEKAIGAILPQDDQSKLEKNVNSSISGSKDAMLEYFDQVASPYPNKTNNQLSLGKRGFEPCLASTSHALPVITVHPASDEPSTQEWVNKHTQPSYSPQSLQYQPDIHQIKCSAGLKQTTVNSSVESISAFVPADPNVDPTAWAARRI